MNSFKNINLIWFDLCDLVRRNRKKIIVLCCVFLVGILIGCWYGLSIDDAFEYVEESPNIYIQINLENKSAFGFFVASLFVSFIATLLVFVFSMHPILSYFGALAPLYFGYCLGFEATLMLRVCGLSALILLIFGIALLRIIIGGLFILLVTMLIEQAGCFASKEENLKICLMFLLAQTVALVLMSIFVPFFCKLLVYS